MASKFIKLISNNQHPTIFGDGTQSRDFIPQAGFRINSTYVVPMQIEMVEANILAATKEVASGIVMNVVYHGQIKLNELVVQINNLLGKDDPPRWG